VDKSAPDQRFGSIQAFHDDLADAYHLVYSDWAASVRRQGSVLNALLVREIGRWHEPEESGFHQPIATGRRQGAIAERTSG
jgi:hypothetical protein